MQDPSASKPFTVILKDSLGNQGKFLVKMEFKSASPDAGKQAQEVVFDQSKEVIEPAKLKADDPKGVKQE